MRGISHSRKRILKVVNRLPCWNLDVPWGSLCALEGCQVRIPPSPQVVIKQMTKATYCCIQQSVWRSVRQRSKGLRLAWSLGSRSLSSSWTQSLQSVNIHCMCFSWVVKKMWSKSIHISNFIEAVRLESSLPIHFLQSQAGGSIN